MIGTSKTTGQLISPLDRVKQSIGDILTTPLGSRVLRGDYGSLIFDLIDQPTNAGTLQKLRAATIDAIKKWEPNVDISQVNIISLVPGKFTFEIDGAALGSTLNISVPVGGA
jgi:Bacteriophage baseplate protein W